MEYPPKSKQGVAHAPTDQYTERVPWTVFGGLKAGDGTWNIDPWNIQPYAWTGYHVEYYSATYLDITCIWTSTQGLFPVLFLEC